MQKYFLDVRNEVSPSICFCFYFAVLGFEFRAYALSHSTSPFFDGFF
jgi:hypothetical protein